MLSWRDEWHPEAGGSERTLGQVARGLVERGHAVTVATARYAGRPSREWHQGVLYVRRGNRLSVYAHGFARASMKRYDAIVDVQNGIPFFAAACRPRRTLLVVHHVHREQWPVAVGPIASRIGWIIESRVSPWIHRSSAHLAVSSSTAGELVEIGHPAERIAVVRNGTDPPASLPPRHPSPTLIMVSRLVPHKQVEHGITCVASLMQRHPNISLRIIGEGHHEHSLREYAQRLGVDDRVEFLGRVDDVTRDRELAKAWVHLLPSLKEGWGLVAVEAAACGTPTIAYRSAGGVTESVIDNQTGFLVDTQATFYDAVERIITDRALAERMSIACGVHAAAHSWKATVDGFEDAIRLVAGDTE